MFAWIKIDVVSFVLVVFSSNKRILFISVYITVKSNHNPYQIQIASWESQYGLKSSHKISSFRLFTSPIFMQKESRKIFPIFAVDVIGRCYFRNRGCIRIVHLRSQLRISKLIQSIISIGHNSEIFAMRLCKHIRRYLHAKE